MNETGWDPDVRKYFRKILNSISVGLFWLMSCATAGIYYELGFFIGKPLWQPILFYSIMIITGAFYLRFLINTWKEK
jgi:hypothetical protein